MKCDLIKANHPMLYEEISSMWGLRRCRTFLAELPLVPDNWEGRHVFSFDELIEIDSLIDQHDNQYRQFKPIDIIRDAWGTVR